MFDPTGVSQNVVFWLRVERRTGQLLLHVAEPTAPSEDQRHQEAVWEHCRPPTAHWPLQRWSTDGGVGAGERSRSSDNRSRQQGQTVTARLSHISWSDLKPLDSLSSALLFFTFASCNMQPATRVCVCVCVCESSSCKLLLWKLAPAVKSTTYDVMWFIRSNHLMEMHLIST